MILENKEFGEFEHSDGIVCSDLKNNLFIEFAINIDPDLIYFKVFKKDYGYNCCRISMTEPKFLKSEIKLSDDELDIVIEMVSNNWDHLVEYMNSERVESYEYKPILDIVMPDYSVLKGDA